MAEPKKRSITGKLVENKLTARTDDFTFNVTYVQSRSIGDLCKLAAARLGTKYSASEIEGIYSEIKGVAEEELYSGSTVEFGFTTNSLGVEARSSARRRSSTRRATRSCSVPRPRRRFVRS